jgi:uncharacterized Zn-finger protein
MASPDILEPHDCQKCRLSFSSVEEHRKHLQDSHPRDFHKCPVCHKVFHSAAMLEKHKAMHSGMKPYSCDLCQKSYQVGFPGSQGSREQPYLHSGTDADQMFGAGVAGNQKVVNSIPGSS